jgi:hypothetical protein
MLKGASHAQLLSMVVLAVEIRYTYRDTLVPDQSQPRIYFLLEGIVKMVRRAVPKPYRSPEKYRLLDRVYILDTQSFFGVSTKDYYMAKADMVSSKVRVLSLLCSDLDSLGILGRLSISQSEEDKIARPRPIVTKLASQLRFLAKSGKVNEKLLASIKLSSILNNASKTNDPLPKNLHKLSR